MSAVIKPSWEEKRIYSNIEDYFNRYINKTIEVAKTSVRSNYNLFHRAYICHENNIVVVESVLSYRLYPGKEGFSPVKVAFYADDEKSYCEYIRIHTPSGEREVYNKPMIEFKIKDTEAGKLKIASIDISNYNKQYTHLDIEMKILEFYFDHWGVAEMQFFKPTDGFSYQLRCENNLEIKDYSTFVYGAKCFIERNEKHEMSISCTEWINEGTGFSVVIGPNDQIACKCWEQNQQ